MSELPGRVEEMWLNLRRDRIQYFSACHDLHDKCKSKDCMDPLAKYICAKTCGFCGTTPSATTFPGKVM